MIIYGTIPKSQQTASQYFFKSFADIGFIFVGDLLNIDGTFISFEKLKQINPNTNFIEYASIRTAVRNRLHTQDLYIPNLQIIKEYGPVIPNHILLFTNNCKGCKLMYNLLLDKKEKHVHLYQNGEKRVIIMHKKPGTKFLNSLLNVHKNQNYIGYSSKFSTGLFRQINIFSK